MNRTDLQLLAEARLEDAQVLFRNGGFAAAYYLAGSSVECALEACIAKRTKAEDFPPKQASSFYTHRIRDLLAASELKNTFEALFRTDEELEANWGFVENWTEESRYEFRQKQDAETLLNAISDPTHGVLSCIRQFW
jgi:HEPN domain-containing protein